MNHDKENFNYQATFDYWSYKVTADVKSINIKNHTYYFFGGMISLEDFDLNLLKIDKKSYKDIDIYYIGYTLKFINLVIMKIFTV